MNSLRILTTILITTTLFFIDICLYGLLEQPIILTLLAYYLAHTLRPHNTQTLIIIGIGLALQSTLLYSIFGLTLIYLIPLTLIGRTIAQMIHAPFLVSVGMICACICTQNYLIDPYILGRNVPAMQYTTTSIAATLIGVIFVFLKCQNGKQGNRF